MILVLQFRTDQSGWHEVKCIYDSVDKRYNDFFFMNIMSPFVTAEMILDKLPLAQAVILGGLGEGGYEDEDPQKIEARIAMLDKITPVIMEIKDRHIPTLGMCFGHQVLADVLGGKVVTDSSFAESGIGKIFLTEEGKQDPLLSLMPETFHGIVSHKSSVVELPREAVLLAYSEKCPIQGFRYKSHIYGLQLHPELDLDDYQFRMELYPEYTQHALLYDDNQDIIAKQILTHFLQQI